MVSPTLPKDVEEAISGAVGLRSNRPLSAETKRTYLTNLRSMLRAYQQRHPGATFEEMLGAPEESRLAAENLNSRAAMVGAVTAVAARIPRLKIFYPKWSELASVLKQRAQEIREENSLTTNQEDKYIPLEEVRAAFARELARFRAGPGDLVPQAWALFVKRLLILSLYACHPPVRQDYGNVRLCDVTRCRRRSTASRTNHILMEPEHWTLVLLKYKTDSTYGRVESRLPAEVLEVARASLEIEPRQYLFVRRDGKPYRDTSKSSNSFTALVNRSLSEGARCSH
eukprot:scaffold16340_cov25-Prasinocladus_malaysianus.AAC.1